MTLDQPLHTQLYGTMLQRIRSGVWRQGDRVPSERSLVKEFAASREPVRQALETLRAEGMIVGGRGSPPRVQRPVPCQSLATLVSFDEWAKSAGYAPGQRVIEVVRRPASEHLARELNVRPEEAVVEVLRVRTLDEKPALFERSTFPYWIGAQLLALATEAAEHATAGAGTGADTGVEAEHGTRDTSAFSEHLSELDVAPASARQVIDAVAANPLDAEWLQVPKGSPLLRARRASYDQHGMVLDYTDSRYLPHMTSFAIENSAPAAAAA